MVAACVVDFATSRIEVSKIKLMDASGTPVAFAANYTASSMLLVELNPEVLAAIKEGDADLAFKATDGGPAS